MSQTIEARFATRAEAENAVELLVQTHGIERSDIFVAAENLYFSKVEHRLAGYFDTHITSFDARTAGGHRRGWALRFL